MGLWAPDRCGCSSAACASYTIPDFGQGSDWFKLEYAAPGSLPEGCRLVCEYLSKPWTPLMHAAARADGRATDVAWLLRHGADSALFVTYVAYGHNYDDGTDRPSEGTRTDTALSVAMGGHTVCQFLMNASAWTPKSHHLFPRPSDPALFTCWG